MHPVKLSFVVLPPSRLTPVPAMLTGRGLRTGVNRFVTTPELVVEVDIALPGRDVDMLFGVISPDRNPRVTKRSKLCK